MKKGFTLVELLAVIAIMGVLAGIAVPTYLKVSSSIKQSAYDTKVKNIASKAEVYAEETNEMTFDVKTLIENGVLEADNELGQYLSPVDNHDMRCDIVNVVYKDEQYEATVMHSDTCYDKETLLNLYGMVSLHLYRNKEGSTEKEEVPKFSDTDWVKDSPIFVKYEFTDKYKDYEENIKSISWSGENEKNCECQDNNLENCEYYEISAENIKNVQVNFLIEVEKDGVTFSQQSSKRVMIDKQKPNVTNISLNNNVLSQKGKPVTISLSDENGSGIRDYKVVTKDNINECQNNNDYKAVNGSEVVEYLPLGEYYVCARDYVYNLNNVLDSAFEVKNIDGNGPEVSFTITSSTSDWNSVNTILNITAKDDKTNSASLKMCISNTGYLQGCSWQNFSSTVNWNVGGNYDGQNRIVYLVVMDEAGNYTQVSNNYVVYKECSSTKKEYTTNVSACSSLCGNGTQQVGWINKDNNTNKTCNTGTDTRSCAGQGTYTIYNPDYNINHLGSWATRKTATGKNGGTITYENGYISAHGKRHKGNGGGVEGWSQPFNTYGCNYAYVIANGRKYSVEISLRAGQWSNTKVTSDFYGGCEDYIDKKLYYRPVNTAYTTASLYLYAYGDYPSHGCADGSGSIALYRLVLSNKSDLTYNDVWYAR